MAAAGAPDGPGLQDAILSGWAWVNRVRVMPMRERKMLRRVMIFRGLVGLRLVYNKALHEPSKKNDANELFYFGFAKGLMAE